MERTRREQIDRLAAIVRDVCQLTTPIDMEEAVARLRGNIEWVDEAEFEASIEKQGNGFQILISKEVSENRRRFSIAHELGHLFIHMGYLVDEEKWKSVGTYTDSVYYRFGYTTEEYEANEFAAALLMPRDEFILIARRNYNGDAYHISPIAEHFQVSADAALNRGRWLGIFSWG